MLLCDVCCVLLCGVVGDEVRRCWWRSASLLLCYDCWRCAWLSVAGVGLRSMVAVVAAVCCRVSLVLVVVCCALMVFVGVKCWLALVWLVV